MYDPRSPAACVCFAVLDKRRLSPAAAAPAATRLLRPRVPAKAAWPPRQRRAPPAHVTPRASSFLSPNPDSEIPPSPEAASFYSTTIGVTARPANRDANPLAKARPQLNLRILPAHAGVTSEERTAMKREGGAAHLCSDSFPESQQQDGHHAPSFSSLSSCRRRQRRRHDKALHAR